MMHLGALPYAMKQLGLPAPVYATEPVYRLGLLTMYDHYLSRKQVSEFDLFTLDDIYSAFQRVERLNYSQNHHLSGMCVTILLKLFFSLCPLCRQHEETECHLWFGCHVSIPKRGLEWQGIQSRWDTLGYWWTWFVNCPRRRNNIYTSRLMAVIAVVYFSWILRNDVVFNHTVIDIDLVARSIIDVCKFRCLHMLKVSG